MKKMKVYKFSDNAGLEGFYSPDLSVIMDMIEGEYHEEGNEYKYAIVVEWMTEEEFKGLPEFEG